MRRHLSLTLLFILYSTMDAFSCIILNILVRARVFKDAFPHNNLLLFFPLSSPKGAIRTAVTRRRSALLPTAGRPSCA